MCFEVGKRMRWRVAAGMAVLAAFAGPSVADLSNGSFETDLSAWSMVETGGAGTNVFVVSSHTDTSPNPKTGQTSWGPTDGDHFALAETDGPSNYQQLYRTFSASAGDVLTLDYFWDSQDVIRSGDKGNDMAVGRVFLGALTSPTNGMPLLPVVEEVFDHSVAQDGAAKPRYGTDWATFSYTFEDSGIYTLWFGIKSGGDSQYDSRIGIDNVYLVPIPAAVLLGVLGLCAAALKLRKFV